MDHKLETEIVKYGVHHLIKDVQTLKSTQKKYPTLTKENEAKLVRLLLEGHQLQKKVFLKTYQQRKKNTDQLCLVMNDVLKGVKRDYEEMESETGSLSSRYISHRYLADKYIRETVMTDNDLRKRVVALMRNQQKFQQEYEGSRKLLIEGIMGDGTLGVKLSKLINHNKQANEAKLKAIIDQFDAEFYVKCKSLAQETSQTLAKLGIPFFNIHSEYRYPALELDKAYMLNYLMHVLREDLEGNIRD